MNRSGLACLILFLPLVAWTGCASRTTPPSANPGSKPDPVAEVEEPGLVRDAELPEDPAEPAPATSAPAIPRSAASGTPEPALAPGEAVMVIASNPAGGLVVMDGRPVGAAPVQVKIPVTPRGFLSRPVSVKVRFLAGETTSRSHTTELVLTPLDRAPVRLDFTPEGTKRTLAAFR